MGKVASVVGDGSQKTKRAIVSLKLELIVHAVVWSLAALFTVSFLGLKPRNDYNLSCWQLFGTSQVRWRAHSRAHCRP